MENTIRIGSIVFHRNPRSRIFEGPGTVTAITHDALFDVDEYTVMWQNAKEEWFHLRTSLLTLAEKEAENGNG